jgi:hypothetical protein
MTRGGLLEVPEPCTEARLAEVATDRRSLHANVPLRVLEDQAVAVRPEHHAEAATGSMYIVPAT